MKDKIENAKQAAQNEVVACEGAYGMLQQMTQQVQNALRASSLQGVPAPEQATAMKYLKPLLDFCAQTDGSVLQQLLRAQGKVQALDDLLKVPQPVPVDQPAPVAEQTVLPLEIPVEASPATSVDQ